MRIGAFMYVSFTLVGTGQPVFYNQVGLRIGGIVNTLAPLP